MKIRYLSDIHLEFLSMSEVECLIERIESTGSPGEEVCVLAGDIGYPATEKYEKFMTWINGAFRKTFVIAGNHEFYKWKGTIENLVEFLQDYYAGFANTTFLHNRYEIFEGVCFVGSILWSQITNPDKLINDVRYIPDLTIEKYNQMYKESVEFLSSVLETQTNCIVITHHMPSYALIDAKYRVGAAEYYNQWFASNLDWLLEKNKEKVQCWFYGHTHSPKESVCCGVRLLCNPIGYPGENPDSHYGKVVEI